MNYSVRPQSGVGLIEVLIAVVVLAIGLLGLAGLQLRTLRDNESASERGIAVVQMHSIIDAMRADRVNATNERYNIAMNAPNPSGTTFRERAIAAWRTNLLNALGPGSGAKGEIACDGSDCWIRVQWDDTRATGGTVLTVETQVQL